MNYPAISGHTRIIDTTFAYFKDACNETYFAIMSNDKYGDIIHPIEMKNTKHIYVDDANKLRIHVPTKTFINPSDCVDMDCDALRKVLISDVDGMFFGKKGGTVISQSEYMWDGRDRGFGLGMYLQGNLYLIHIQ